MWRKNESWCRFGKPKNSTRIWTDLDMEQGKKYWKYFITAGKPQCLSSGLCPFILINCVPWADVRLPFCRSRQEPRAPRTESRSRRSFRSRPLTQEHIVDEQRESWQSISIIQFGPKTFYSILILNGHFWSGFKWIRVKKNPDVYSLSGQNQILYT